MGRVLLIIGATVGVLILAFGVLGLILAFAQPDANQSDEAVGSIFFMVVGAIVAAPCIFFAYRIGARSTPPWTQAGSSTIPTTGADLRQSYMAWFAWCQQALGGDSISMHAATMAALAGGAGNPAAAASAEAARQANRVAASGVTPAPPRAAKVRSLAQIGASTVGLLEPSERVLVSFIGANRPAIVWTMAFGAIGSIIASSQMSTVMVTVTDRRVIAVGVGLMGGLASRVALLEPRSSVSAKFPKGIFGRTLFSLKGQGGGSVAIIVPRPWRPEAEMALELLAPSAGQAGGIGIIR